ncbi:MAG: carbon-nitrogen hydrolase family protein, partial [Candidatus Saccharimonadales bacterium]
IDPAGEIILEYEKNNLWHPERTSLTPGTALPVVKTPIGTIGIIICWDITAPEICRELAKQGADIICCPSYWMDEVSESLYDLYPEATPDATMLDALCPARAIENEVLFIYANNGETAEVYLEDKALHLQPVGHSQIACPILGTVAKLGHGREGVLVRTYNPALADAAEKQYKFRQDHLITDQSA